MNEFNKPAGATDGVGSAGDHQVRVPDTSMLPGSEKAPPAALGLLNSAVQGAHHTIDRLAESATPAVRQLGESVSAAKQTLHVQTDHLREARDEWVEGARCTVRSHPLVAVASALALGVFIARLVR